MKSKNQETLEAAKDAFTRSNTHEALRHLISYVEALETNEEPVLETIQQELTELQVKVTELSSYHDEDRAERAKAEKKAAATTAKKTAE